MGTSPKLASLNIGIRLCQNVSEASVSSLAVIVRMRVDRFMGLRIGEIGKKWLLGTGLALDEIDGLVGDFAISRPALGAAIHFQFLGLSPSLCGHDVGERGIWVAARREAIAIRPEGSV